MINAILFSWKNIICCTGTRFLLYQEFGLEKGIKEIIFYVRNSYENGKSYNFIVF